MKIKLEKQNEETIHIDDITDEHIVVAVIEGVRPYVLSRKEYDEGKYIFLRLGNEFTNGNSLTYKEETIKDIILSVQDKFGSYAKIEAFHQSEWFEAMKWLNENTKKDEN